VNSFDLLLDTTGLICPEPVMMLHRAVLDLATGKVIKVIATDPSTTRDIPRFCEFLGHDLLLAEQHDHIYQYFIRRA
jgi:tRNA 2-thiouridine synthesizing protein A